MLRRHSGRARTTRIGGGEGEGYVLVTGIFGGPSTPSVEQPAKAQPADETQITAEARDRRRDQVRSRNSRQQTVLTAGQADEGGQIRRTVLGG